MEGQAEETAMEAVGEGGREATVAVGALQVQEAPGSIRRHRR